MPHDVDGHCYETLGLVRFVTGERQCTLDMGKAIAGKTAKPS